MAGHLTGSQPRRIRWGLLARDLAVALRADLSEWAGTRTPFGPLMPPLLRERRRDDVVFVHVPKNAGSSISRLLYGDQRSHHTALFYRRAYGPGFARAESFAVLRDPVERCLSTYRFVVQGGSELIRFNEYWSWRTRRIASLADYLEFLWAHRSRLHRLDPVMRPQSLYVLDETGRIVPSRLFLLGGPEDELSPFLRRYSPERLPHINATRSNPVTATPEQAAVIRELYRSDVELIARCFGSAARDGPEG